MSHVDELTDAEGGESVVEEYVLGVRIVEVTSNGADGRRYRFEAPQHEGTVFDEREQAALYADVYHLSHSSIYLAIHRVFGS